MRASGTFKVVAFTPASAAPDPAAAANVAATMEKQYEGDIAGHSATSFAAAVGTCVAMEAFEGTMGGRDGAFNFAHSLSTGAAAGTASGFAVNAEKFIRIVPASGTGLLAGIHGTGGMTIDANGTHRIWFEYELG